MKISTLILFHNNSTEEILACLSSVSRAFENAKFLGLTHDFIIGFTEKETTAEVMNFINHQNINCQFFNENIYHSKGINKLSKLSDADFCFILNPDTVVAPDVFKNFLDKEVTDKVAAIECRQIPFDHPKIYDPIFNKVTWVSGACVFIRREVFNLVNGFDERIFPMYCNDVDFSIRVRSLGFELLLFPDLRVFHKKLIGSSAKIVRSEFEQKESLISYILMHTLYSDCSITDKLLEAYNPKNLGFWDRLCEVRMRKKVKISKDLREDFFVKGEFGRRNF
jgi:GT2 family glycosyltransferase